MLFQFYLSNFKILIYEVIKSYQDKNIVILEFKITMDETTLFGVDFIEWENGKMKELRCYYNPTDY